MTGLPFRVRRNLLSLVTPSDAVLDDPVFVIGCGRSGTTALGETLGRHPTIAYLNEPREIWALEPKSDLWGSRANGSLELTAADETPEVTHRLQRAFYVAMRVLGGVRLVEKLPINAFRVGYLAAAFPRARFIHLVRNGADVADSISRYCETGVWFGKGGRKWDVLRERALSIGLAEAVGDCTTNYMRGLLEWRLAVMAASDSLARLPDAQHVTIRYEDLLAEPSATLGNILRFIGVEPSEELLCEAAEQLARRSKMSRVEDLDAPSLRLALPALERFGYA